MDPSFVTSLKEVLQEAFDGPGSEGSYFTESKPGSGLFGTLNSLSPQQVSTSVHGATIAAHTDHIRYYLWVFNTMLAGKHPEKDWQASWKITSVDETRWREVLDELQKEYSTLLGNIDTMETSNYLDNVVGCIAHSSYHLGALRQMVKAV